MKRRKVFVPFFILHFMKRFLSLCVALLTAICLWAGNVITYTATEKLPETTERYPSGLHTNAFGDASISSHTFSNGTGTITFNKDITQIGERAFYSCSGLTSLTIPNSVTSIGRSAFSDCSGLTSLTIPNLVTSIGDETFYGCSGLTSLTIPNSVTSIGMSAFSDCSGLTSLNIPNSVTSIGNFAFDRCSGLTSLTIPNSVTSIGYGAFSGCKLKPLHIEGSPGLSASGKTSTAIRTFTGFDGHVIALKGIKNYCLDYGGLAADKFFAEEGDDWADHAIPCLLGVKFYEPYIESVLNFRNIKFYLEDGTELPYTKTDDGYYTVKGLKIDKVNYLKVTYIDGAGLSKSCEFIIITKYPYPDLSYSSTQSTVTIKSLTDVSDETCTLEKVGINYKGVDYTEFPLVISDLYPGEAVSVKPFAYYNGVRYDGSYKTINAAKMTLSIKEQKSSYASTLSLNCSYTKGDADVTDAKITINGKTYAGNKVTARGLDPNTKYTATYSLKANGHEFSQQASFTTPGLTMKTSQPKVINVGNVIVAAEANLDEEETNVGFEWRRTDWTSDFASNTGGAYMYNGQMEGYIRNLNAEKLWKYRPYYLSDSGKYYYGDWVGLDPSNTSYFEATVHTYDKIEVEGNTALVKGYALRGTDPIKVQGFVYWKKVAGAKAMDGRMYAAAVPSNAKTVEANGQIMSATLADLDYDSEYAYVAFVTTTEGETFYGEERTFKTEADTSGISDVMSDNASSEPATVMGYYDLNGRRIQNPERGIYIIRYSDGSSRKFMKK